MLTEELELEIKKVANNRNISLSKAVRELLTRSLQVGDSTQKNSKKENNGLLSLDEYQDKNPRIRGMKELMSVGANVPEVTVIAHSVLTYYKENGSFSEEFLISLNKIVREYQTHSLTKKLVVRRAYVVPGMENPPGPRFIGLAPEEVEGAIKKLYDFAIEQGYSKVKGSQIVAFLLPFVDPEPLLEIITQETVLPYGGSSVPVTADASRVDVYAVWGNNEGVLSFDAIDRYTVNTQRMIIESKDIPQKNVMLATTKKSSSEKIDVPIHAQFQQVLGDYEIIEMARIVKDLTAKYGPRKIEFSFDGKAALSCNESSPYEIVSAAFKSISARGEIVTVGSAQDLQKEKLKESENIIVYISPEVVENRSYELLNLVAGLNKKYTVLYPGLSATAHAMRVLSDFGHTAIVVGNRKFVEGEKVAITVQHGDVFVERLSQKASEYIVNLYDAKLFGREMVGGKALNLSILKGKGFNVPHGISTLNKLFEEVMVNKKFQLKDKWHEITNHLDLKKDVLYAVRSSASVEDHSDHSFAGQFESYLNVSFEMLPQAVEKVMQSTFAPAVIEYFKAMGKPFDTEMAVVVQEMVNAKKAGVIFGKDLQTYDQDILVIDAGWGLGDGVVDGTSMTERIYVSKSKRQIVKTNNGDLRMSVLLPEELFALVEMAARIESVMGSVQDIEWAIDQRGGLWVIQTRAI
jgi:phosphoenolpyruvate synthase/pyruvate phosphate dikinase